jgi:hypothetical protein
MCAEVSFGQRYRHTLCQVIRRFIEKVHQPFLLHYYLCVTETPLSNFCQFRMISICDYVTSPLSPRWIWNGKCNANYCVCACEWLEEASNPTVFLWPRGAKLAKNLLKNDRNNLILWNAYAQHEKSHAKIPEVRIIVWMWRLWLMLTTCKCPF